VDTEVPAGVETTPLGQDQDSRPPEVAGERPQLLQPQTLEVAEHDDPPAAIEPAKPELPTADTGPQLKAEIPAVESATPAGIEIDHISEPPHTAEPQTLASSTPKGIEKFLKPAGIVAASVVAAATLGGIIWAFDKWKNRGTQKEVKKKAEKGGKKERRHVRQWTVYDE
jgi:hypothetical protein